MCLKSICFSSQYLSDNDLSGQIPDTIMTLIRLNTLSFYNNNLDPLTTIRKKHLKAYLSGKTFRGKD